MNVKLKKFKILEPNVKIKTNVNIVTFKEKGFNFTDISGEILLYFQNNMTMITGTIQEV
jgi:hypothetical protein